MHLLKTSLILLSIFSSIFCSYGQRNKPITLHWINRVAQPLDDTTNSIPLNSFSLDAFANASVCSINYERIIIKSSGFLLITKFGIGFNPGEIKQQKYGDDSGNSSYTYGPPVIIRYISANIGKRNHFIEIGIGNSLATGGLYNYPSFGYRYISSLKNKACFRLFFQIPLSGDNKKELFLFPIGTSIGIVF